MAKVSQRQIVATISPTVHGDEEAVAPPVVSGTNGSLYFTQVSGGEITAAVEKVYDGGMKFPEVLCATADIGDITVTRHYDTARDAGFLAALRHMVGSAYYDITISEMDCDLLVPSTMRQFTAALVVGLTEPDGDAASGAPASYSVTLSVGQPSVPTTGDAGATV